MSAPDGVEAAAAAPPDTGPLLANADGSVPPRLAQAAYWALLAWYLAIPLLGVLGSGLLGFQQRALLWLFIPAVVYAGTLLTGLRLQVTLSGVLLEMMVPAQITLAAYFSGVSPAVVFMELCLIEVGARGVGIGVGTMRVAEIPVMQVGMGLFLIVAPLMGLYPALLEGYAQVPWLSVVLFSTAFVSASARHVLTYWRAAGAYKRTANVQIIEVLRGRGGASSVGPLPERAFSGVILVWLGLYFIAEPVLYWLVAG